eukprot:123726-Chlamydomonas_euryale.AAC.1
MSPLARPTRHSSRGDGHSRGAPPADSAIVRSAAAAATAAPIGGSTCGASCRIAAVAAAKAAAEEPRLLAFRALLA